ncbi:protein DEK-like isoform X1 [Syngnathus acus]|uniref:protein DEK-like isoform X1 n=1 Tax=Syngnathus acus TaxID=161584 RepID=UPI001885B6B9|nr:protein DEK-like isoform X1 [Syngnathus acus]XP_037130880.1 protein DEK-like isoform X1 [Syngnathus acus]
MSDVAEEVSLGAVGECPESPQEDKKSTVAEKPEAGEDGPPMWAGQCEPAWPPAAEAAVAGKRAKKSVARLDLQAPKHKELKIAQDPPPTVCAGSGDKLGNIPRTNFQIGKLKSEDLKPLHTILFERPGKMASIKKNLRLFSGFPFPAGSDQYLKKRDKLVKNAHFTKAKLKLVCGILDLEKKGTQVELVDRILTFLLEPKSSGKLPVKKKKRSKKKVATDVAAKGKKAEGDPKSRRVSSSSSSPKKTKGLSKSKAIVMDSSSEDDDQAPDAEASDTGDKLAREEEDQTMPRQVTELALKKRSRTPAKKTLPQMKRVKRDLSDADSDINEAKKNRPAAKTKKADSSSKNTNADDTSDEDEPLIRMIKRAPSDDELKETVCALLKKADLAQITMKQICQRVFDTYPDHDLSGRKDFIKQSVKSLIT